MQSQHQNFYPWGGGIIGNFNKAKRVGHPPRTQQFQEFRAQA